MSVIARRQIPQPHALSQFSHIGGGVSGGSGGAAGGGAAGGADGGSGGDAGGAGGGTWHLSEWNWMLQMCGAKPVAPHGKRTRQ